MVNVLYYMMALPSDGITFRLIQKLVERYGGRAAFDKLTTEHACDKIEKLTKDKQCPYIDLLRAERELAIENTVDFISHAWRCLFLDTFDTLIYFYIDPPDTVFCFDIFPANQHQSGSIGFQEMFQALINELQRVVMILAPYDDPIPFTRMVSV